ncbi:hypothetical protein [Cellulophaga sp. BC115SP]|uniref:hypothetical protein n=1 Tax=Cellulophaga sp. BC115SP TaxID=2683263 RepID=UPI001413631F|nr:hypothetical protein [Cellulophaga sp. BC115SP]NBB28294.1 hypothetical protein [Cellulophaga sp. BC115SP]
MNLNTRSFLRIIIPFGVASLLSCTIREPSYREYTITQCEKDTAILVDNLQAYMGNCHVSIIVEGSIDSTAIIDLQEHNNDNYRKNPSVIQFRLAKGIFSKKGRDEIYAKNYVLYYDHQKATKGNIKIKLQLLDVDNRPL